MSRRRKPSPKEISDIINQAVPPVRQEFEEEAEVRQADSIDAEPVSVTEELPPIGWRKSTIPFREDQYSEIGRILAEFHAQHEVQLTIAEIVRLGLDKMIQALSDESARGHTLVEIYEQQQRESQGNEHLKHSRSRGLSGYLAAQDIPLE